MFNETLDAISGLGVKYLRHQRARLPHNPIYILIPSKLIHNNSLTYGRGDGILNTCM